MAQKEKIKEIMTSGVISVSPEDSVKKAVDTMTDRNISCVIVTEGKKPIGIITERDLVQRVLKPGKSTKSLKAKDIMTPSVVSISDQSPLEEGLRVMESMKIRRLPVVSKQGLSGLVTQSDIVKETYNIHKHNQRLQFHQNIQSYVIIALAVFFVVAFILRFWFV